MTILLKNKINRIIGFGIYLILGFALPWFIATFTVLFLDYKGYEFIVAIIFLTIMYFAHYKFRNIARNIGLINKQKIYWLERTVNIFALFLWIAYAGNLFNKYYLPNN